MHMEFFSGVMKIYWNWVLVTIAQPCEYTKNHLSCTLFFFFLKKQDLVTELLHLEGSSAPMVEAREVGGVRQEMLSGLRSSPGWYLMVTPVPTGSSFQALLVLTVHVRDTSQKHRMELCGSWRSREGQEPVKPSLLFINVSCICTHGSWMPRGNWDPGENGYCFFSDQISSEWLF